MLTPVISYKFDLTKPREKQKEKGQVLTIMSMAIKLTT